MNQFTPLFLLLLLTGCAQLSMMPPKSGAAPHVIKVTEPATGAQAGQRSLQIGTARVRDIWGTHVAAPGTTPYGRSPDSGVRSYSFKLEAGSHLLTGECNEQARESAYFGLGPSTVDLRCRCSEATTVRAALLVTEGRGEALLPENRRYAVWEAHESGEGPTSRAILGYRFRSPRGEGGVDTTQKARAYLPRDLADDHELPLTCLYAALLLHQPKR